MSNLKTQAIEERTKATTSQNSGELSEEEQEGAVGRHQPSATSPRCPSSRRSSFTWRNALMAFSSLLVLSSLRGLGANVVCEL